jgi:Mor family transcriptional regulator
MAQADKAERDAGMYACWNDGLTLETIAREYKVTRETVRLAVRLMERKAMWREINRNSRR